MITFWPALWESKKNWFIPIFAGLAGLAVGYFLCKQFTKPEIKIVEKLVEKSSDVKKESQISDINLGPIERVWDLKYIVPPGKVAPPIGTKPTTGPSAPTPLVIAGVCQEPEPVLAEVHLVEHIGAVSSHQEEHRAETQKDSKQVDLTMIQTDPTKHYSLFLGAEVLPQLLPALGGAVRLGPIWLQGQVAAKISDPLKSEVTTGVRFDF